LRYNIKSNATDATTFTWNFTDAFPAGDAFGRLRVQSEGGNFNKAIYQKMQHH